MDYSPYRKEITVQDLAHLCLITVVILITLWLAVQCHQLHDGWYACFIPLFVIVMLGLITRQDTMVHRLGGFLLSRGEPFEKAKQGHKPTKVLIPLADVLIMVPVFGLLVYGEVQAWDYITTPLWRNLYLATTLILVLIGIGGWIAATTKARTGFEPEA